MSQPQIFSRIDKAVFDYSLIEENDKILIGASGGKDSAALIEYFCLRKRRGENFQFEAVHVQSDFSPEFSPQMLAMLSGWGCDVRIIRADVIGRLKTGRKMNCWWCATQRRTELVRYAMESGFNKIALGHHADDILETLIMNMTEKAELATMPPRLKYEKYPVTLIRPLCYVPESMIVERAQSCGYLAQACTCAYQENSGRKAARAKLDFLCGGDDSARMRILNSLKNVRAGYLM